MLRVAKHLDAHPDRPFAALRVTKVPCHAEHIRYAQCKLREAARRTTRQTLRCAQGDKKGLPEGHWCKRIGLSFVVSTVQKAHSLLDIECSTI